MYAYPTLCKLKQQKHQSASTQGTCIPDTDDDGELESLRNWEHDNTTSVHNVKLNISQTPYNNTETAAKRKQ